MGVPLLLFKSVSTPTGYRDWLRWRSFLDGILVQLYKYNFMLSFVDNKSYGMHAVSICQGKQIQYVVLLDLLNRNLVYYVFKLLHSLELLDSCVLLLVF